MNPIIFGLDPPLNAILYKEHGTTIPPLRTPQRLIFKSPYINDAYASIEMEVEGKAIYGLIKSASNPIGNRVILGKGMQLKLFLMFIVDVLAEDIFDVL
jgi:hypothetical protein